MGDIAASPTKKTQHHRINLMAELLTLIEDISGKIAKDILPELLTEGGLPRNWLSARADLIRVHWKRSLTVPKS